MGWWDANPRGGLAIDDTGIVWGDGPADILDNAIDAINREFKEVWGRSVTLAELKAGFAFSTSILEQ